MLVKFYDPHPGIGGAAVPLPMAIKTLIDSYDGKEAQLSDLLEDVKKIPGVVCWALLDDCYVACRINSGGYTHQWRLIRWGESDGH
jgi:hypothetical protein